MFGLASCSDWPHVRIGLMFGLASCSDWPHVRIGLIFGLAASHRAVKFRCSINKLSLSIGMHNREMFQMNEKTTVARLLRDCCATAAWQSRVSETVI